MPGEHDALSGPVVFLPSGPIRSGPLLSCPAQEIRDDSGEFPTHTPPFNSSDVGDFAGEPATSATDRLLVEPSRITSKVIRTPGTVRERNHYSAVPRHIRLPPSAACGAQMVRE